MPTQNKNDKEESKNPHNSDSVNENKKNQGSKSHKEKKVWKEALENGQYKGRLDNSEGGACNLQGADLSQEKNLLPEHLAGKNLSGARLPKEFNGFEEQLRSLEESSKNCRKILLILLLVCAYSILTIITTTDVELITNLHSSPLPIMQSQIKIGVFYLFAPFLLLTLYVYFHLSLQRFWDELADLPAIFPNGRALDQMVYPWLFNGYIRAQIQILSENRPPYSRLQTGIVIFIAWWVVPITLGILWWSYLKTHDWIVTTSHIIILTASFTALVHFQCSARKTLRQHCIGPSSKKNSIHSKCLEKFGCYGEYILKDKIKFIVLNVCLLLVFSLSSYIFATYIQVVDIHNKEVSIKPSNWTGKYEKTAEEIAAVTGAELSDKNLCRARAGKAFLVKANLYNARLQKINFENADLRHADLKSAVLRDARLVKADLRGAHMSNADLQKAELMNARLQGASLDMAILDNARLYYADLQGTNFNQASLCEAELLHANLKNADLRNADFRNTVLEGANLNSANLLYARNLTVKQLLKTNSLHNALLDDKLLNKIRRDYQYLFHYIPTQNGY